MDILKYKDWGITVSVLIIVLSRTSTAIETRCPLLIIDHDGGADDAMAIFMALLYEDYFYGPNVIALTTTHGNVDEDQTFINSQRILTVADRRDVPIYRGSNFSLVFSLEPDHYFGNDGLGDNQYEPVEAIDAQPQHAAIAIIELTKQYPGEITLVALGALTNVALAVRIDPSLIGRLAHLYVGAGNVYSDASPNAEFNAAQDAESYHAVIQNANPEKVTIIPFSQVRNNNNVSREWRKEVLGAIPTKIMEAQNNFERINIDKSDKWELLDPVAMGTVLNDTIVGDIKYSQNSIILCGDQRGINTNSFTTIEEANVKVVNGIIDEEYKNLLYSIFSAQLNNTTQSK